MSEINKQLNNSALAAANRAVLGTKKIGRGFNAAVSAGEVYPRGPGLYFRNHITV